MAKKTRLELEAERDANVTSGGRRITGLKMRNVLSSIYESFLNFMDDKDAAEGYPGLDGDALIDLAHIKQVTPQGKFVKDDGTWAAIKERLPINDVAGAAQQMSVNNEYISNNNGSNTDYTLPVTAAVGDKVSVIGGKSTSWQVLQNSGQSIHGATSSTTGSGGKIASASQFDSVLLICTTANTSWTIQNQRGNIAFT